jgi:hypothetical protein
MNYTKGQWKINYDINAHCGISIETEDRQIATVYLAKLIIPEPEGGNLALLENSEIKANAQLIVAAPNMYKVLKMFIAKDANSNIQKAKEYLFKLAPELKPMAIAAINKAEGK